MFKVLYCFVGYFYIENIFQTFFKHHSELIIMMKRNSNICKLYVANQFVHNVL